MAFSGVAFVVLLILPCTPIPDTWRALSLGAALVPYHLYFSQLYCEAHVGAHVTVLVPPALLMLSLSPALDSNPIAVHATSAFTCWMVKIILTSAYCSAGICKIGHSVRSVRNGGSSWCSGSTLQAFIFEAMFLSNARTHSTFGVPTPFSHALQRLHLLLPSFALSVASYGAVAFETFAPLLLLAPAHMASVPFGIFGLTFHYGIALLQNIDFLSWWGPVYAFILADPAAWAGGSLFVCPPDPMSVSLTGSVAVALEVGLLHVFMYAQCMNAALIKYNCSCAGGPGSRIPRPRLCRHPPSCPCCAPLLSFTGDSATLLLPDVRLAAQPFRCGSAQVVLALR